VDRDKSSRTLTAGQLIEQLSKVDPSTPVVMSQEDEPCGDYGVRGVEVVRMQRENTYADGAMSGMDVFHRQHTTFPQPKFYEGDRYEQPQPVVFLSNHCPWQPTIDADVVQAALPPVVLS
jgi:hypothetical protein